MKTPPMEPPVASPGPEPSPVPAPVIAIFATLRKILRRPEIQREVTHDPDGVAHTGSWRVRVSVEPDPLDGGYVAECLDVPGAMGQGETVEEALESAIDAIQGVVATRMEDHLRSLKLDMPRIETSGRIVEIPL